jgi:outer membrane protein TolC
MIERQISKRINSSLNDARRLFRANAIDKIDVAQITTNRAQKLEFL